MRVLKNTFNLFSTDIWMLKFNPAYLHHVNGIGNENGSEKVKESAKCSEVGDQSAHSSSG